MIKAKKSLGQNFLNDEMVLQNIANSIKTRSDDLIIEIGPGMGALTKYLVKKNSYLRAYEIDLSLKKYLDKFNNSKTKIIYEDFLKADIDKEIEKFNKVYIIANIPYYITTLIVKKAMMIEKLESMSLLVQKEVAERFTAKEGSKDYGSLSVYLQYYFEVNYLFTVKNTCFRPVPKVDSALVNFRRKENGLKVDDEEAFFKFVNDAFRMKRKNLRNNLNNYDLKIIEGVLKKYHLDLRSRAEEVGVEVFIDMYKCLRVGKM